MTSTEITPRGQRLSVVGAALLTTATAGPVLPAPPRGLTRAFGTDFGRAATLRRLLAGQGHIAIPIDPGTTQTPAQGARHDRAHALSRPR